MTVANDAENEIRILRQKVETLTEMVIQAQGTINALREKYLTRTNEEQDYVAAKNLRDPAVA